MTPRKAGIGTPRRHAGRGASERPGAALRDLLRCLRAGGLESVLLTAAMAAGKNRMPRADPDGVRRTFGFLAGLAQHDPALPPHPGGSGSGSEEALDAG